MLSYPLTPLTTPFYLNFYTDKWITLYSDMLGSVDHYTLNFNFYEVVHSMVTLYIYQRPKITIWNVLKWFYDPSITFCPYFKFYTEKLINLYSNMLGSVNHYKPKSNFFEVVYSMVTLYIYQIQIITILRFFNLI
jgi:hypothetical protein